MFISWIEAFTRVGHAKYGSDWIDRLTEREKYLIDEYRGSPVEEGLPEHSVSKPRKARPIGAALENEIGRADDRRRWKIIQDAYVGKWLKANGFWSTYPRVNLFDLNIKIQEEFIFGDWWSEDGFFEAYWFEENITLTAPALGMDECEAKTKKLAVSLDCAVVEPRITVRESHRPYKLAIVTPKGDLTARVWEFLKDLDQKGQLQYKKQCQIYRLIRNRFKISGENVISRRTMRRLLGLDPAPKE
jgi:hypothetical protein